MQGWMKHCPVSGECPPGDQTPRTRNISTELTVCPQPTYLTSLETEVWSNSNPQKARKSELWSRGESHSWHIKGFSEASLIPIERWWTQDHRPPEARSSLVVLPSVMAKAFSCARLGLRAPRQPFHPSFSFLSRPGLPSLEADTPFKRHGEQKTEQLHTLLPH